jgi:hypothetical protein
MRMAKSSLAAILAATTMLVASPALAHTKLVSSTPAANATVRAAPRTITLTFNERVVPAFSKFELTMPDHRMNIPLRTTVSQDGKRIVGTPQSPLAKGSYAIHWTAAGADGHKMEGHFNFKVG